MESIFESKDKKLQLICSVLIICRLEEHRVPVSGGFVLPI